jgi:hypothetical protein
VKHSTSHLERESSEKAPRNFRESSEKVRKRLGEKTLISG